MPKKKTPDLPDELVLSGDYVVDAQIEGQPVKLQVRPDTYGFVTLNDKAGQRLGLNFDKVSLGLKYRYGPYLVDAPTKTLRINLGAKDEKNRVVWTREHKATAVADGIISPISLPYKRVAFILRETVSGPVQQYTLPLDNFGFLGLFGIGNTVKTGKAKMQVQFSLARKENLVAASAANWLANWRGGVFAGQPEELEIAFAIKRPVRRLEIPETIAVGPFTLNSMLARTGDNGDTSGIKNKATPETVEAVDEDEIVVTGKKQKDEDNTIKITLGSDFLQSCKSLTYDLDKRQIHLLCAMAAPAS